MTRNEEIPRPSEASKAAPEVAPTMVYQAIQLVLKDCLDNRWLGVVTGPPGVGKTTAGLGFANTRERVIYYRASPVAVTAAAFVRDFASFVGVHPRERQGCLTISGEIASRLSCPWKGARLLVVDEAQALSIQAVEVLREYFDTCRIGLALLGNVELRSKIANVKHDDALAPMVSRAQAELEIQATPPDDFRVVAVHYGLDDRCADRIVKLGEQVGLRRVVSVIKRARVIATDRSIGLPDVETAASQVLGRKAQLSAKRKST